MRVWQLLSPVNEIMTRQEEKVLIFSDTLFYHYIPECLLEVRIWQFLAGANIKVDLKAGFTRRPLANTCSSHLHLSTFSLNEFKTEFIIFIVISGTLISLSLSVTNKSLSLLTSFPPPPPPPPPRCVIHDHDYHYQVFLYKAIQVVLWTRNFCKTKTRKLLDSWINPSK